LYSNISIVLSVETVQNHELLHRMLIGTS